MAEPVACECAEGLGYPHHHVTITTVRHATSGEEITLTGYAIPDLSTQWLHAGTRDDIRFFDEVTVSADDLDALLRAADLTNLDRDALGRLTSELAKNRRPNAAERAQVARTLAKR